MELLCILAIVFGFIWGLIASIIAMNKGHNTIGAFMTGFVFGPFGVLAEIAEQPNPDYAIAQQKAVITRQLIRGQLKKCRYCAELIQSQAVICRYCGREQIQVAQTESTPPEKQNTTSPITESTLTVSNQRTADEQKTIDSYTPIAERTSPISEQTNKSRTCVIVAILGVLALVCIVFVLILGGVFYVLRTPKVASLTTPLLIPATWTPVPFPTDHASPSPVKSPTQVQTPKPAPTQMPKPAYMPVGSRLVVNNWEITVTKVDFANTLSGFSFVEKARGRFAIIFMNVTNKGYSQDTFVAVGILVVKDASGNVYEEKSLATSLAREQYKTNIGARINPDVTVSVLAVYDISASSGYYTLSPGILAKSSNGSVLLPIK